MKGVDRAPAGGQGYPPLMEAVAGKSSLRSEAGQVFAALMLRSLVHGLWCRIDEFRLRKRPPCGLRNGYRFSWW